MPKDVSVLAALESRSTPFPWSITALQQSLDAGHHCLVCCSEEENELLAYSVSNSVLDETSLLNICVDTTLQGQGIGKALLKYIIQAHEKSGANKIMLEVRESNRPARHLYESLGFIQEGRRKGYYPAIQEREDACLYCLLLGEPPVLEEPST